MVFPLNILILTSGIYPDQYCGISKLAYNVGLEFSKKGHCITVISRKFCEDQQSHQVINGMEYFRIPLPKEGDFFHFFSPFITAFRSWLMQKKIKKSLKEVDLVWIHNPWWVLFSNPKKLWPKTRVVYDFHSDISLELVQNHGNSFKIKFLGKLYDRFVVWVIRKVDFVIVHSKFTYERCAALLGKRAGLKIRIVSGGADPSIYYPLSQDEKVKLKQKLLLPLDCPVFMTARGLKRRTGVDKLIKAAFLLKKNQAPFYLIIIGSGPQQEHLLSQIKSLGLEGSIRFLGKVSEDDLALYYRASDVFVLPTQGAEGFGLATIEALLSGLVVLGTNNSATPEILSLYKPEWIIPGCDSEKIFKTMLDFCQNPSKYMLPATEIREITTRNFSWNLIAERFLEFVSP